MKKAYEGHEFEYRRMMREGILAWDDRGTQRKRKGEILKETEKHLAEVLRHPWVPTEKNAIELGCGTGPIARWLCSKMGYSVLGVDVSKTAIEMARLQSNGLDVRFRQGDVCTITANKRQKFDMAVDGHCLHCITDADDRKAFFTNAKRLLRKDGLLVIMTMCGPMDMAEFSKEFSSQKFLNNVIYIPWDEAITYQGACRIDGRYYLPTRYIGHWQNILKELTGAGFELKYIKYLCPVAKNPCGDLIVGAINR